MTAQTERGGFEGVFLLGVNLAALPPARQAMARLDAEAAGELLAGLAEIFVGIEAAIHSDAQRTEVLVYSRYDPQMVTAYLCHRYFDDVTPDTPSTHPLGLRYQLEGVQVAQRQLQIAAGAFEPGFAGAITAPATLATTPAVAEADSRIARLLASADRVADRTRRARDSLWLANTSESPDGAPDEAPELVLPLAPVAETIVTDELERLRAELKGLAAAASRTPPHLPWPEALQLTNRPHLPEEGIATLEKVTEVALWSARGLLHDCAQHLGVGSVVAVEGAGS